MAKTLPTFDPTKGGSQISGEVQWEFNNLVLDRPWHRDQNPGRRGWKRSEILRSFRRK